MAKKHSAIATLWANKVFNGDRSFEEVPPKLVDEVKIILIEKGYVFTEVTDNNETAEDNSTDVTNNPA